ncbi:MAG TPA: hypothetical protein DEP05_07165 [Betaproteobacteria bacterium]|nr:hypothetical protein [Betaproteobacteria bacterium]
MSALNRRRRKPAAQRERPLNAVPRPLLVFLAAAFALQIAWHAGRPALTATAHDFPPPPPLNLLRLASLGEPTALAKALMLYIQAFDDQPGVSIPFRRLDYPRLEIWLRRVLQLDPRGQYPLLAASRLYGEIPDKAKQRQMLQFVYRQFFADPNRRWPWLAHAAILAKYRLHDLPLARRYARAIRRYATGPGVPHWARQMEIFILADMHKIGRAEALLRGLLASGEITDPHERHFLTGRLHALERREPAASIPESRNPSR